MNECTNRRVAFPVNGRIRWRGALLAGVLSLFSAADVIADEGLTFFGWSDQHVETDGDGSHLVAA